MMFALTVFLNLDTEDPVSIKPGPGPGSGLSDPNHWREEWYPVLHSAKSSLASSLLFTVPFLLADFKENHTVLFPGFKNPYKKSAKQANSSLFMNSIL